MGPLMRLLLALFAFVALALAPVGMPAEARAMDDHCAEMVGMDHQQPQSDHDEAAGAKSCCSALAAALPAAAEARREPVLAAAAVTMFLPVQHGLRREVEVPPPRG